MARIETIDFNTFMKNEPVERINVPAMKFVRIAAGIYAVMVPKTAMAAADATFGNVFGAALNIVDWLAVGVFMFAGVSWMFGHRGKALELIIGGAAGYLLARHSMDIRDFLKSL